MSLYTSGKTFVCQMVMDDNRWSQHSMPTVAVDSIEKTCGCLSLMKSGVSKKFVLS